MIELTIQQARTLHLAAQGLVHAPRHKATQADLLAAIDRMQLLQIDSIHVIARSPYLVLFSRVGPYPMAWLTDLLADGKLAECWAHEACFAPSRDVPLHHAARPLRKQHWAMRRARRALAEHPDGMRRLLDHIRENGSVRAADFSRTHKAESGWWDWKPEKRWLEAWFALGELMVERRERFQRVYDITERIRARHPAGHASASPDEARRIMLERSIKTLGIARSHWIADYYRLDSIGKTELERMLDDGTVTPVRVRGWQKPAFVHRDHADLLNRVADGRIRASHTTLLSPFDPVVWDRRRARELFGFDYRIECYVPAPKRRYGYFVLPILHRGRLVGRLDAKAHRNEGVFEIRNIVLEERVKPTATLLDALARAIDCTARWHDTPDVRITKGTPATCVTGLHARLQVEHDA